MRDLRVIKSICTDKYEVSLYKDSDDMWVIYTNKYSDGNSLSENISDFNMASYLFDIKVQEFEGH
jgi:hypothetical protein